MRELDLTIRRGDQLAAIAGLRWRLFVNALRTTRGKLELLSQIFIGFAFAIGGLGGAFGMGIAASMMISASRPELLALLKLSRAKAAVAGRDFVVPEDVKVIAVPALAHRLTLRPELWVQRVRGEDVVAEALESVPTPPAEDVLEAAG